MRTPVQSVGHSAPSSSAPYFPVSIPRFVALSVLTWGLYQVYWFYKNWAYIRDRDRKPMWAPVRGFLYVFSYPFFLADLRRNLSVGPSMASNIALPIALFVLALLSRLPDPFWLVSVFSFVPILPALAHVNSAGRESPENMRANSRWKARDWILLVASGPLLAFVAASSTGVIPSTQVTPGWMVWGHTKAFLERSEVLEPDEEIVYFYSAAPLSYEADGNLLTDRRVISYWTDDDTGEFFVESADFAEIRDIDVRRGDWVTPTAVTVHRGDGSSFLVVLSAEDRRDRLFIDRVNELRTAQASE